jgi:hypothetical protein
MNPSDPQLPQAVSVTPTPLVPPPPVPVIAADVAYGVVYTDGAFLTSAMMNQAQTYFVNWLKLQNQLLYTAGVLNGLVVSHPGGNSLAVSGGAGIDEQGCFVVLPDNSGAVTVPSTPAKTWFLGIAYPSPPPPGGGQPNVVNTAGVLAFANTKEGLPLHSLLLAEIAMANGVVTGVTDRRIPVDSRLPANLGAAQVAPQALRAHAARMFQGKASVPIGALRQQGDRVRVSVPYSVAPLPAPPFDQPPRVLVTVLGAEPYATAVSEVDTTGFQLTLTAIHAPKPDVAEITVEWIAHG